MRRLRFVLAAASMAASTSLNAAAQTSDPGNGGDNAAVAVNTHDGSSVFRIAFSIVHATGDTVDNSNAAVAFASCTACETVAIAFQVVLISGDPSTITPANEAIAVNFDCTLCATMADAVQFVLSSGPVRFTPGAGAHPAAA
jgi:putative peptide zinc metalloprotease protein